MEQGGGRADADAVPGTDSATSSAQPALPDSSSTPSALTTTATPSNGAPTTAAAGQKKKKDKPVAALDFFSPSFDPLLALNTPGLRPPIPDVKPLISVQMCRTLLPDTHSDYRPPKPATQQVNEKHEEADTVTAKRASATQTARQPRAQPAAATNPLTLFTTAARVPSRHSSAASSSPSTSSVGPLSLLQSLVTTQQRCRVLLRSHHSLHSILTAQLRAFDRHCNLYLVDVQQSHLTTAQLTVSERQRRKGEGGGGRRWEWVGVERRVGVWQRQWVGQLMVRGECVMSVSRCSESSEAADALITGIERDGNG